MPHSFVIIISESKKGRTKKMTDKEKVIVMAYTGTCMLTRDKLDIFYNYLKDLLGYPVYTHELANTNLWKTIKEKSKADFLSLCEKVEEDIQEETEENPSKSNDDYSYFSYNPFTEEYGWDC